MRVVRAGIDCMKPANEVYVIPMQVGIFFSGKMPNCPDECRDGMTGFACPPFFRTVILTKVRISFCWEISNINISA